MGEWGKKVEVVSDETEYIMLCCWFIKETKLHLYSIQFVFYCLP